MGSLILGADTLNAISGRYGSVNRWWSSVLAGSVTTRSVEGAAHVCLYHMNVALVMVIPELVVYSGTGSLVSTNGVAPTLIKE